VTQPHKRYAMLLAALIAAWQPSSAQANPEDTQLWLVGFVRGNLSDDISLTIDTSQRWREDGIGGEQRHLRVALDHHLTGNLKAGGGMALFTTSQRRELRPHQQLVLLGNGFELRTRFEQRFFDAADQVELRLRQRLQYAFPLKGKVRAVVAGEWLKILQGRDKQRPVGTQEVRGALSVIVPLGKRFEITPSYLLIVSPRPDLPDRITHIPQVSIGYHF
jgi:hypothetical protein